MSSCIFVTSGCAQSNRSDSNLNPRESNRSGQANRPIPSPHEQASGSPSNQAWSEAWSEAWSGSFQADWQQRWRIQNQGRWGNENLEIIRQPHEKFPTFLRVRYPAQSASPAVSKKSNAPLGGSQFYATLGLAPQDHLRLSYSVRFPADFNFVRGGKLPGLYGGMGNSGGQIPNGRDGFSSRLMWREGGAGEVYAYLPTSQNYGTSLGQGRWRFVPGRWQQIEQELWLNQPGQADGRVRIWLDGKLVFAQDGLVFRTVPDLKIEGLFFSTFFGGGDESWATPRDTAIDFADFEISVSFKAQ